MANETTIKIKLSEDGTNYTAEIVEVDARSGSRLDQKVAQNIIAYDNQLRQPQTQQMFQAFRQNPMAAMRQMMSQMMAQGGNGMPGGMPGQFPGNMGGFGGGMR
jgi:hypothetical protein